MAFPFVYLIDDDEDDRDIFQMALRDAMPNAQCHTVNSAVKALEELEHTKPDYLFIDLNMPRMSGRECLEQIKKCPILSGITSIIYTTSSHHADIDELQKLGANHYLIKPDSINKLIFVLKEIVSGTQLPYLIKISG
jgi:CheY-like chemotaxis protein